MADLYLLSHTMAGGVLLGGQLMWKAARFGTVEGCPGASHLHLALTERTPRSPSAQPWMEIVGKIPGACCGEEGGADWLQGESSGGDDNFQ